MYSSIDLAAIKLPLLEANRNSKVCCLFPERSSLKWLENKML